MRAITLHEEYTWNWRYINILYIFICPNNGPAQHYSLSCKDMLCRIESKLNHSKRERERERRWTKNFPLHFMSCWDTDFCLLEEWEWSEKIGFEAKCISWQAECKYTYIFYFFELKVESQEKSCLLRFHPTQPSSSHNLFLCISN